MHSWLNDANDTDLERGGPNPHIGNMEISDEMLSTTEAAELLRVSPQLIRLWVHRGDLPAVRIGRSLMRVRRADVLGMVSDVEYRKA